MKILLERLCRGFKKTGETKIHQSPKLTIEYLEQCYGVDLSHMKGHTVLGSKILNIRNEPLEVYYTDNAYAFSFRYDRSLKNYTQIYIPLHLIQQ